MTEEELPTIGYGYTLYREENDYEEYKIAKNHPDDQKSTETRRSKVKDLVDELVRREDYRQKMMSHVEQLLDQAREYDNKGYGSFADNCREMAYYIWTHILGEDRENFSHKYADLLDELTGAEWLKDLEIVEKKNDEVNG